MLNFDLDEKRLCNFYKNFVDEENYFDVLLFVAMQNVRCLDTLIDMEKGIIDGRGLEKYQIFKLQSAKTRLEFCTDKICDVLEKKGYVGIEFLRRG